MKKRADFRFYEELNDFLPVKRKKTMFSHDFFGKPTVKDAIEAIGVPHTEVDLVLVNGSSVSFSYHLMDKDNVSVYPVFESLDISDVTHLREKPLREPKFILDVHLGKLAKYLRMLGLDVLYDNTFDKAALVNIAVSQKRTILTRDVSILKIKDVTRGYWIRSQNPQKQVVEIVKRFDLYSNINPLSRCIVCNGKINQVLKDSVIDSLQPKTRLYYNEFFQCVTCRKVYWKGSHHFKMTNFISAIKENL